MSERYAAPPPFHNPYDYRQQPAQTGTSTAITLLAIATLTLVAWNTLSNIESLSRWGRRMLSRASFGLIRRPMAGFGGGGSALDTLHLGTDTIQRGLGSMRSILNGGTSSNESQLPAGLGNWDNSCFQNSVIQGLASLRSLPGFLQRVADKMPEEQGMNAALLGMIQSLNAPQNNGRQLWLPPTLKTMNTWQQQDAQEYFSKVLDVVDKEALKVAKKEDAHKINLTMEQVQDSVRNDEEAAQQEEKLHNPLEGLLAQRVGCRACGHSDGISLTPFNCLTVPLGAGSFYDIRDCLDAYTQLEDIDGVQCPKCTLISFRGKLEAMATKASDAMKVHISTRLDAVVQCLNDDDYSDNAITKKCAIPKKQWIESTKSKQAVVARAPRSLVIHVNRSIFDELTGAQLKNPAAVQFPPKFGLGNWMLGAMQVPKATTEQDEEPVEEWPMDPRTSMLPEFDGQEVAGPDSASSTYELRAIVTHFGRHENGHYVAYRKHPCSQGAASRPENVEDEDIKDEEDIGRDEQQPQESWWRLSDEDVSEVDESFVLRQGGVFMLFYERVDALTPPSTAAPPATAGTSATATTELAISPEAASVPLPASANPEETPSSLLLVPTEAEPRQPALYPTPPESIAESETEPDDKTPQEAYVKAEPVPMRTANVLGDDKNSGESVFAVGNRMVSAS